MNAESTPTQSLNSPLSYFSAASVIFIAVQGERRLHRIAKAIGMSVAIGNAPFICSQCPSR
jgi:hypothetical protein